MAIFYYKHHPVSNVPTMIGPVLFKIETYDSEKNESESRRVMKEKWHLYSLDQKIFFFFGEKTIGGSIWSEDCRIINYEERKG